LPHRARRLSGAVKVTVAVARWHARASSSLARRRTRIIVNWPQLLDFRARSRRRAAWHPSCSKGLYMLLPEQVQRLFQLALVEFAPDWEIAGAITELSVNNGEHWVSGLGTFGLILRNSPTSGVKVLGWRTGRIQNATYFRGISYRVLEAYADRITDPIRRYFEEIGILVLQDVPAWSAKPPERSHTRYA
jgi:hypothetical protein